MKFICDTDPVRFDDFVRQHPTKSHFMQSAAWGAFNEAKGGFVAHYTTLQDADGGIVAAALLLERKPPLFPPYLYAPRGYVLDYADRALLAAFTEAVRDFAKARGAMFVQLDPDIELQQVDRDAAPVSGGWDNHALVEDMKALGYRHRGYNKGFDGRQPRYTFYIDLVPKLADIEKAIEGNVMKNVRKSHRYAIEVSRGGSADVADLHRLITITSERDDFVGYDQSYYQKFFDVLDEYGMAELWLGTVYPARTVEMLRQERRELLQKRQTLKKEGPLQESIQSEQRLDREIAQFERYAEQYPGGARVSAHLVVRYGDKAWAIHAGSDDIMRETFVNNRVYYEKIKAAKESGAVLLDQFGTVGDPEHSPLRNLHAFKRQFGGRCVEYVGAFDLVLRPFWYFVYEKLMPLYRSVRIDLKLLFRKKK